MTTEDIQLPTDGSWLGIPMTGTYTIVHNGTIDTMLVRFGSSSNSFGMKLKAEDTLIAEETVYVRMLAPNTLGSVRVTR